MKLEGKFLKKVATELSNVLALKPPIKLDSDEEKIKKNVMVAIGTIRVEEDFSDEFSEDVNEVIEKYRPKEDDAPDEEDKKPVKKGKKEEEPDEDDDTPPVKKGKDKKDEESDEPVSTKADIEEEIRDADTLNDLKDIANEYDEFKSMRKELGTYKNKPSLMSAMLNKLKGGTAKKKEEENDDTPKKDKKEKAAPAKKEKKEKEERAPSAYGTSVDIMCTDPDMTFEALTKKLQKKGIDTEAGAAAIRTGFGTVRKVVSLLRENDLMK